MTDENESSGIVSRDRGIVSWETIEQGLATDAYFLRTEETLDHAGKNPVVAAEVTADQFPDGDGELFVGLDDAISLFSGMDGLDLYSVPEGVVFDGGPVMRIVGNYRDFARYETALLGMLSETSGYATAAKRITNAARDVPVLSFGSRHNHPAMAAKLERAAYIGGVDGYSNVAAEGEVPMEPSGTMPHALMLSMQDTTEAWKAFNEAVPDGVPRIVLADTWDDEVRESIRAAKALGDDLDGVRLDTTSSRRGDFAHIIKEVRYELDAIGREDVDIFVSGGIDVEDVLKLRSLVDGFGVGSYISDADSVDFSLDIVWVEGNDTSKRGKLPGMKDNRTDMTRYINDGKVVNLPDGVEAARERANGVIL